MCIVMGADTATNTQPAASPRRYLQFLMSSMLRLVTPILFLICLTTSSCHKNKSPTELIEVYNNNKVALDLIISNLQNNKKLDTVFQIAPDAGIPNIKKSDPAIYDLLNKVGITDASSHQNSFPKRTQWYYFKTNWPNRYPIYLIYNAYDSIETKKGLYEKDEVSNETWGLGDNWKMIRLVKFKPYKQ